MNKNLDSLNGCDNCNKKKGCNNVTQKIHTCYSFDYIELHQNLT